VIEFGKILKELRTAKGITQEQLANVLRSSKQNVSRWEKGYFEPDQKTTIMIADYFDVSIDYLFGRSD
jgi:transcriptional regulator with XRE-family HTH domain